jgi:6-phosphogluconolactonase
LSVRRLSVGSAEVNVLPDEAAVAREASRGIVEALRAAIESRGTAHLVLTGGSSAVSLYRELAANPWHNAIAWDQVHMWFGDERFVPRDHPESNAGLADRTLFAFSSFFGEDGGVGGAGVDVESGSEPGLVVDADKVHPMPAEEALARGESPAWAADQYVTEIARYVPEADGVPVFDVILAGIGPDGHTLSLFPNSPGLKDDAPIVLAADAPDHVDPHLARVTLSARVLAAASLVIVMSAGAGKQSVIADVLGPERDVSRWPAQAALLPNAIWLIDESAAGEFGRYGPGAPGNT